MAQRLPPSIERADRVLDGILRRIHFSRYLNPTNVFEAREAWRAGSRVPPFRYRAATWADGVIEAVGELDPDPAHPFGPVLRRAIDGLRRFSEALRDRTPAAFDALAEHEGWFPTPAEVAAAEAERPEPDRAPLSLPAERMLSVLRAALDERGLGSWRVERDPVMSARILVDGAKRVVRIHPRAAFRERDAARLVAHEIDVHVARSEQGRRQPLRLFATGLPGALETEEGLALLAERLGGAASPGQPWRTGLTVRAIPVAREGGFSDVVEFLRACGGGGVAWGVALRLKRGLADPGGPGVYAKDVVYHRGLRRVQAWLASGGRLAHLFVGKVGVGDPVGAWIEAGLVLPGRVPPVFSRPG